MDEAKELGLPEEVVADIALGLDDRARADEYETEAKTLKERGNKLLLPALKLLELFTGRRSVREGGRVVSLVYFTRKTVNAGKMKEYLVGKGVPVGLVVKAATAATTETSSTSVRVAKEKGKSNE